MRGRRVGNTRVVKDDPWAAGAAIGRGIMVGLAPGAAETGVAEVAAPNKVTPAPPEPPALPGETTVGLGTAPGTPGPAGFCA